MDNPFMPAVYSFAPLLLLLAYSIATRGRQPKEPVPAQHLAVAYGVCIGLTVLGFIAPFLFSGAGAR